MLQLRRGPVVASGTAGAAASAGTGGAAAASGNGSGSGGGLSNIGNAVTGLNQQHIAALPQNGNLLVAAQLTQALARQLKIVVALALIARVALPGLENLVTGLSTGM